MERFKLGLRRLGRAVWLRASLVSLLGLVIALVAGVLGPLLPSWWDIELGQGSVTTILQILASSMLAVTTFSVTAMVSSLSSAANTATPRATAVLAADRTTQAALSSFVGAFVFAIVGIVALNTGYYTENSRVILFLGTLVVVAYIVITLLRWIAHLVTFGRMADVIDRIEETARRGLQAYRRDPHFGGSAATEIPESARIVAAGQTGFLTHVAVGSLQSVAEDRDLRVHLTVLPGDIIDSRGGVLAVEGPWPQDAGEVEAAERALRRALTIEPHRTFDQDPRLGVVTMSEIGSRALSAATNDPGTAIETIAALHRLFRDYFDGEPDPDHSHDRVHVPVHDFSQFVDDAYLPLLRDGAGSLEVGLVLQRTLGMLRDGADASARAELDRVSRLAEGAASEVLTQRADRERLQEAAQKCRTP